jgi:hypothetical protein
MNSVGACAVATCIKGPTRSPSPTRIAESARIAKGPLLVTKLCLVTPSSKLRFFCGHPQNPQSHQEFRSVFRANRNVSMREAHRLSYTNPKRKRGTNPLCAPMPLLPIRYFELPRQFILSAPPIPPDATPCSETTTYENKNTPAQKNMQSLTPPIANRFSPREKGRLRLLTRRGRCRRSAARLPFCCGPRRLGSAGRRLGPRF